LGARIAEDPNFPAEFKGIAIGNGYMHVGMLLNSLILWSNYHGLFSLADWEILKSAECCDTSPDADNCDWSLHMTSTNGMDFIGDNSTCGKTLNLIFDESTFEDYDPYNFYQSCYTGSGESKVRKPRRANHLKRKLRKQPGKSYIHNTADIMNRDSTDPFWGYPCFDVDYVTGYLNRPEVQDAFHIDPDWRKAGLPFLDFASSNNFGKNERKRWDFRNQLAGFHQRYFSQDKNFTIDVLTVNGNQKDSLVC
ncbi:hypothetical protein FO519_009947, partial [Halicephalobus sp. NKZ332]